MPIVRRILLIPLHLLFRTWIRYVLILVLLLGGISVGLYYSVLKDLPSPSTLTTTKTPQSTRIFDRNHVLLYTIYGKRNQTFTPLSQIPTYLKEATIAIEDKNFYDHGAVDFRGIARALYANYKHQDLQGGSTLTQQLVKNSLLTPQRTIDRKIKEAILAITTEIMYPKDKILEMYLNQSPYGGTAWGAEAAAQTYFGKHVKDLDLAESAMVAGLPEAPSVYSPFGSSPELGKKRQLTVLQKMQEQGYITKQQEQKAATETLPFKSIANDIKAPHFVMYVKDLLIQKYGEERVEEGGLTVITSLDLGLQDMAQQAVADQVASLTNYHVGNGATVITKSQTGEVLAMVGSINYFDTQHDGMVNLTTRERQPGSSIKPINYALGLTHGYTAANEFVDKKTCFTKTYCPVNYDGKFHGTVTMRTALGNSLNIPAVKMLKLNGLDAFLQQAKAMGITTFGNASNYGLSLTLGGGEVKMIDMAGAFGVFANQGKKTGIHPILKVTDKTGDILEQYQPQPGDIQGEQILDPGVAFIMNDMLSDNNARLLEFGPNSALVIPNRTVAVKTGTTNDFRDNWTIGYTPTYLVATWVGNNDNSQMDGLVSGITGAAPLWNTLMTHLITPLADQKFPQPDDVIGIPACSVPNYGPNCQNRQEYFIKGTEPQKGHKNPFAVAL